jgi:hypothetical protein
MDSNIKLWLLTVTGVLLISTKALDIISTYRNIHKQGEANPLAKWVFDKFGLKGGMVAVAVVYTGIVLVIGYQLTLETNPILIYTTLSGGLIIAAIQFDVARANITGKHSTLTKALIRVFSRLRFG